MCTSGNIFRTFDFYLLPLKFKIMFMAIEWKLHANTAHVWLVHCIHYMPIKCNEFQMLMHFKAKTVKNRRNFIPKQAKSSETWNKYWKITGTVSTGQVNVRKNVSKIFLNNRLHGISHRCTVIHCIGLLVSLCQQPFLSLSSKHTDMRLDSFLIHRV